MNQTDVSKFPRIMRGLARLVVFDEQRQSILIADQLRFSFKDLDIEAPIYFSCDVMLTETGRLFDEIAIST